MNKFLAFLLMLLLVISTSQAARPLSAQSDIPRFLPLLELFANVAMEVEVNAPVLGPNPALSLTSSAYLGNYIRIFAPT
ncbi:hypothetical protein Goari_005467 [Gossypium aridum]|uniref:Uncharacterized protein n=1 Tax=Gossypium aridum TaxID=34290 RepID=A0A7J8YSX0_GOSAI|nr:hypothetical protein [Gossypium aridum]